MNNELISIIVPIYNTEKYLHECLNSIQQQTYPYFECIMVNDGSTDSSGIICQEYVENDSRFRYFEKDNGGVASARNLGLERSGGAYITFIDSDDWVEPNYLDVLYTALKENDTDVAISTYKRFAQDGVFYLRSYSREDDEFLNIGTRSRDSFLEILPRLGELDHSFYSISSKLIKREIIGNLLFDEQISYAEDLNFFFYLYLGVESVVYVRDYTYVYRTHDASTSQNVNELKALQELEIYKKMFQQIDRMGLPTFHYFKRMENVVTYRISGFPTSKAIREYESFVSEVRERVTYQQPLISLIVPIYNVENYLWSCLDSIAKQTYSNIEVLLVNDGSPDGSAAICQEFVARDSRFRYIEKENGGLSDARNVGIARAKGEFLSFVDSDDWIEPTYVEDLYRAALFNDAEVVVSNYKKFDVKDNCYWIHIFDDYYETHYSGEELIQQLPALERKDFSFTTSWGILFARRLFDAISFPKGKTIEDTRTNYRLFAESSRLTYIHKALYNYRVGVDSISSRITEKLLVDVLECLMERMAVYAVKGWNVADERENVLTNLKMRYNQAKEAGLQNTEIFKRYTEFISLLE
ncbi:glycosyl transferase 2 family protein [Streptococcus mitis]|uniref:Glycosyl transferase 2 family protein n=1 Tax=Streptococcus mitis TaxID=28037 RepID=A0A081PWK8_STRMT|nr:glycosyltransferase [Streptococcus mitis]KEQ35081.1 glycosyl transferase 2 family protein [Streptococcus mitis]